MQRPSLRAFRFAAAAAAGLRSFTTTLHPFLGDPTDHQELEEEKNHNQKQILHDATGLAQSSAKAPTPPVKSMKAFEAVC